MPPRYAILSKVRPTVHFSPQHPMRSVEGDWGLKIVHMAGPARDGEEHHVNSDVNADDCVVRLGTRCSSSAMAVKDVLWGARPFLALPVPRVRLRRYQADV